MCIRDSNPKSLSEKRPYIVVGAFVIGMMLTPPDMISQTLLAIPMCILFEVGLFFARFYVRKDEEDEVESWAFHAIHLFSSNRMIKQQKSGPEAAFSFL